MRKLLQLVAMAVGALLSAPTVDASGLAQQRAGQQQPPQQRPPQDRQAQQPPPRNNEGQGRAGQAPGRGQQARPGRPGPVQQIQRLSQMSPEDRRRFLQNLPPRQRQEVVRRLQDWNRRSPEERRAMLDREQVWQRMSPEQRQRARTEIFPRWQQLPQERKQAIQRRLRALGPLSEAERVARLQDENFLRGLNDEDRSLLRELAELRLPPPDRDNDSPPDDNPPLF